MKNKNYEYSIGEWVKFSHVSEVGYTKNNQRVVFHKKTIEYKNDMGQIVGAVRKHVGSYIHGSNSYSYNHPEEYEQPYLESKGTILFFLVRTGMLNKPKMVSPKYLTLFDPLYQKEKREEKEKHFKKLPWFDTGWTDTTKRKASNMMKGINLPRDKKGRFI